MESVNWKTLSKDPSTLIDYKYLHKFLEYNEKTGIFIWKKSRGGSAIKGNIAGYNREGYIIINLQKKNYSAHRLAWLYTYGEWPEQYIDHIDRNKSNNAISNLRDVSPSENMQNMSNISNNSTGYTGVYYDKSRNKYVVQVKIDKKTKTIGRYVTLDEAILIRAEYVKKYYINNIKIEE